MSLLSHRGRILAAWLALCVIWGSTYLAIRVGVATFPPFWMAGVRFLIAGGALTIIAKATGAAFPKTRAEYQGLVAIGVLLTTANALVTWGEQVVPSGLAALIGCSGPVVIAAMALASPRHERLRPRGWAGLALGFVGLVLLLRPSGAQRLDPLSLGALLIAVLFWGSGSTLSRRHAAKCDPIAGTGIEMLAGSILWLTVAAITEHGLKGTVHLPAVLAVAYLIVFGSCIAFTVFFWLLRHVPAPKASTYAYINPIIAVVLGWAILHEALTPTMAAGAAVTLAGVFLTNTGKAASAATGESAA